MGYTLGVLEGFQKRREQEILRHQEQDAARRQTEGRIYEYLLQSQDPEIRTLAMAGLFESALPGKRKRGLSGFLGEIEGGSIYPMLRGRMEEMVPVEAEEEGIGGGPAPPRPGSAAMTSNQPVRSGSQMINLTPATSSMPEVPHEVAAGAGEGSEEADGGGAPAVAVGPVGAPPPAPPAPSRFRRRGTGVPTAEEIAEINARAGIEARIKTVTKAIIQAGGGPADVQRAILGIAGAPPPAPMFGSPSFGVRLPGSDEVVPVTRDNRTGQYLMTGPDGRPVPIPPGAEMVRMSGTGAGGSLTTTIRDSPAVRAQYGIDPSEVTPSGYWKIRQTGNGDIIVMPGEYSPPPAFSGTTRVTDPDDPTIPVIAGVDRGGEGVTILDDAPETVPSKLQQDAKALLKVVDKRAAAEKMPGLPARPGQLDAIVQQEATKLNLPWKSYADLMRAAETTPEQTPRQRSEGGSMAERVRNRILKNRGQSTPPPPRP